MRIHAFSRSSFSLILCLAAASAQAPALRAPQEQLIPSEGFRVPLHTHPAEPGVEPYGLWAGGDDYKASFHDGVVFYPFLGPAAAAHLPFSWRTEGITTGGEILVSAIDRPTPRTSDWRHELHYRGVIEAYDVRADGLEQTFTLLQRPAKAGDWVVTGRITTALRPAVPQLVAAHQEVVFVDQAGTPRVRYGAATAIDATGDRLPVTTQCDGERIRLTVDGAWLQGARFPVVLDPLTAAVVVNSAGSQPFTHVDLASTPSASGDRVMVAFSRTFAAGDHDVYAVLTNATFASSTLVFAETSTAWDSDGCEVAFTEAAARWVMVFNREIPAGPASTNGTRVWMHDRDALNMSGALLFVTPNNGAVARWPDVGGSSGDVAMIVYDMTFASSGTPIDVQAVVLDARNLTLGTHFRVPDFDAGVRYVRRRAAVNQYATGSPASWVAVWQDNDTNLIPAAYTVRAQRITAAGQRAASGLLTPQLTLPADKLTPKIDGDQGRYLVAYVLGDPFTREGPEIQTVRFAAPASSSSMTVQGANVLLSITNRLFSNVSVAFDRDTSSHWAIAYQGRSATSPGAVPNAGVVRVGYTGGIVEAPSLISGGSGGFIPAVTFQRQNPALQNNRFLVAYASPGVANNLLGREFSHSASATASLYGTGCGSGTIASAPPRAGTETFRVQIAGAPATTAAILCLDAVSGSLPLDAVGMTGCTLNVSPAFLLSLVTTTNGAGQGSVAFPLPDRPAFVGDLYLQWLYLNLGANPAGLQATRGLRASVR